MRVLGREVRYRDEIGKGRREKGLYSSSKEDKQVISPLVDQAARQTDKRGNGVKVCVSKFYLYQEHTRKGHRATQVHTGDFLVNSVRSLIPLFSFLLVIIIA